MSKSFEKEKAKVSENTVLKINTNYTIPEQTQSGVPAGLGLLGFDGNQGIGLNDILANIKNAETDEKIKGIYIELGLNANSYATLQEIRINLVLKHKFFTTVNLKVQQNLIAWKK